MVMNKKIVFLLAVVLAVALSLPRLACAGDGLTLTVIGRCVNADTEISCEQKRSVNVKVSYGAGATLELSYINEVAAQGSQEATTSLEDPIRLAITKTLPTYRYPLRYVHSVPYQPYEEVRKITNDSVGIQSCIDDPNADNPSCGWTLDSVGTRIPDSQGFCSNRDLLDLKSCGDNLLNWRGDEVLGEHASLVNSYSTAYCLRRGTLFFAGYEIDTPRRSYAVKMEVYKGEQLFNTFMVTPEQPISVDKTSAHQIKADLLGEARPLIEAPDLSGYMLYVPETPSGHPMVQQYWNNMLLVPRNMVTIDGSECNKVGASFTAFRKQQGTTAPTTRAGDCFGNQLFQLHQEDLTALAGNPEAETRFLTSGMKMFKSTAAFDYLLLQLKAGSPEMNYSTISLELDNAQIGTTTNEASAWIKEATCSPFSSMSKEGRMKVIIQNVGQLQADYMVTLHDCYPGIVQPIPPQARTLIPQEIFTFSFDIMTSVNMEGEHYCWVTLSSPQTGRQYDELQVFFDTHPYVSKTASQWQQERRSKDSKKAN